jgi:hypothetical protein
MRHPISNSHLGLFGSQRVLCETAPIEYSIGEPQKNDLSDTGSWLLSFKGGM